MIAVNRATKLLLLTVLILNYPYVVSAQLYPADGVKTLQGGFAFGSAGATLNAGQSWGGRGPTGMYMYIQHGTPDAPAHIVATENWMHIIEMQHQTEAAWMGQIGMDYFNDGGLYWRHQDAWSWRPWRKVASEDWVTGQFGTQARNNAGLQGSNGARSGFFETLDPINYPNVPVHPNGPWWHLLDVRHSNPNNNYAMQFSGSFYDQKLYFRKTINDPSTSWSRVVLENSNGQVGIGTDNPRAALDIGRTNVINTLTTVLARLPEGDATGEGTYLGVRVDNTQPVNTSSFTLEHKFHGQVNSSIKFYRGGGYDGGFLTFSTNNGTERMRIAANGNIGIGVINPPEKLSVDGTIASRRVKVTQSPWPDYVFEKSML